MSYDVGFTHIALPARDPQASIEFYARFARMMPVHDRIDADTGHRVVWLSDKRRPFVLVLIEAEVVEPVLLPCAHLGIGCISREEVDTLCDLARREGRLVKEPADDGPPVGYWAVLRDPDGHSVELAYGQEVGLTVEES